MRKKSWLILAIISLAACRGDSATAPPSSAVNFPGFDTSIYPGDAAMAAWKSGSPYVWSGFYLPAPCHRDPTWSGKRPTIAAMGWGIAVIYVGQQTFDGLPSVRLDRMSVVDEPNDATRATAAAVTCSRTLLSREQGIIDADDAIAKTLAEGFAPLSVIFLDLEHMNVIPPEMEAYYRAWAERVLADGRYRPGVYVHKFNAPAVYAGYTAVFQAAGISVAPRFWLTTAIGFSIDGKPTDVGYQFTNLWQGILDTDQTWNGVMLHIDVDIADRPNPSMPG